LGITSALPGQLNDVILQRVADVAETADQARSEPKASTMRQRRLVRESLHQAGDPEAVARLRRLSEVRYDEVLHQVAYGTPEAVVERLQEYGESLGIAGYRGISTLAGRSRMTVWSTRCTCW
jgi:alkanesulfonate monooxygenase SsuD/methylene tetrahydromethanopterin reductase-like flavin-dependent oxidoreductase (luciferase family)